MTDKISKIKDFFTVGSSKRVLKSDWKSSGVPFYRGREITLLSKNGYVDNDLFITDDMYSKYEKSYGVPKAGDIMMTAIGTIGNTYIVRKEDKFYFKDASVLWLKKEVDVNSEFINFWFKSSLFFSQLDIGLGATVDTLTIGKVQNLNIHVPSLEKQNEIVAKLNGVLGEIDRAVLATEKKLNEFSLLRESVLKSELSN